MKKLAILAAAVAAVSFATPSMAAPLDFNGYLRAGLGSAKNGRDVSVEKNKLGRLGNENDVWGEFGLNSDLFHADDLNIRLSTLFVVTDDANGENTKKTSFDEVNLQVKGLIPGNENAVIWAGKRHYQREDMHIVDKKYIGFDGKLGAGIEYLQAGPGQISLAWLRQTTDKDDALATNNTYDIYNEKGEKTGSKKKGIATNFIDARYAGWAPWDGAWTEFGVAYAMPQEPERDLDAVDGTAVHLKRTDGQTYNFGNDYTLSAIVSQSFSAGFNKTVVQYSTGALAHHALDIGTTYMDYWGGDNTEAKGWNIINTGDVKLSDSFCFNHVVAYGHVKDLKKGAIKNAHDFRVVVRPIYQLTKYTRAIAELGAFWDVQKDYEGKKETTRMQKLTLAYAIAPDAGFSSRPEVRFFATYFHASDYNTKSWNGINKGIANHDGDRHYKNMFQFGVQGEAWW